MKNYILTSVILIGMAMQNCNAVNPGKPGEKPVSAGPVIQLGDVTFKKLVYNYDVNREWKFEGDKPVIIDFYADWCAPCRQLSPLVEEIAREYNGKIVVYKVDTEKEKSLAGKMGITALPSLLFIPVKGQPRMSVGYLPKESLIKAVNEVLLVK